MGLNAGSLNRRIQMQRATVTRGTFGDDVKEWNDHGTPLYAMRRDVSDAERIHSGALSSKLITRFTVRSTAFTRDLRRSDQLIHEGVTFQIDGIKEVPGRRAFIEITAWTEDYM